jgi:hypothetical protein
MTRRRIVKSGNGTGMRLPAYGALAPDIFKVESTEVISRFPNMLLIPIWTLISSLTISGLRNCAQAWPVISFPQVHCKPPQPSEDATWIVGSIVEQLRNI